MSSTKHHENEQRGTDQGPCEPSPCSTKSEARGAESPEQARALLWALSRDQRAELLRCADNRVSHTASITTVSELRTLGLISRECWELEPLGRAVAELLAAEAEPKTVEAPTEVNHG